jgi:hypothetical protein
MIFYPGYSQHSYSLAALVRFILPRPVLAPLAHHAPVRLRDGSGCYLSIKQTYTKHYILHRGSSARTICLVSLFRSMIMPEREVCSPVSRPGSKVGSEQPLSPGARSNPSRGRSDSLPPQPTNARVSRNYG